MLDFYRVDWQYEPVTFVLRSDDTGAPTLAFSPDFYLPKYELYLELTTMQQRLVTKKNRKARLLREQHPGINIKILYRRDYLALARQHRLAG